MSQWLTLRVFTRAATSITVIGHGGIPGASAFAEAKGPNAVVDTVEMLDRRGSGGLADADAMLATVRERFVGKPISDWEQARETEI